MKSDSQTPTLAAQDDDDDDFQNPTQAIAITQNLILSSLTNPSSQPRKPSTGSRPRKRPKPAASTGKESRISDRGVLKVSDQNRPTEPDQRVLSASTDSRSVDLSLASNSCILSSGDEKENWCIPRIPISGAGIHAEKKPRKDHSAISADSKEVKGSYYAMSIESRLLESRAKTVTLGLDDGCLREDEEDFEIGTQLCELRDLCCEMGEEVDDLGVGSPQMEGNGLVECPLCGVDITGLNEEMRQVHTNDCLDKDPSPEGTSSLADKKSNSPQQVDIEPVLEWLRSLGLSRYEEVFIREEIDWETLQWLTEEDLLGIGILALGPRKKIVHALNELRKINNNNQDLENVSETTTKENIRPSDPGNKLITEFFQGSLGNKRVSSLNKPPQVTETSKDPVCKKAHGRKNRNKTKVKDIPPWCCIPGTPFRVDAFRFLRGDCSHWFLTHFHTDHYQGLTRNFCNGKIYCSSITAHLVNLKLGVPWDKIHIIPLNQKITIAGVSLTCLDANHCPGSIIILFEPPNGKAVLHTGDFRFSAEMAKIPLLQSCHVHTLILDTTYCNPQYDFPKQEAVIQFVIEAIQAETFNPRTLFLIGTYTIGKERLFVDVARLLKKKIYVGHAKLSLLRCLELPKEDMQWFTANEMESHIHVVPMWTIASFKRMKYISNQYAGKFNLIVAFSPTGWTFGKGKKKTPGRRWQQGTIIRYEVPYSEHCSFSELREFVKLISPERIIPSVNNDCPESASSMITLLTSDP